MNVDIAALRAIEREKDIPFETVLEAIESALLTAYKHTEGHHAHSRVEIDRKTGVVRVLAQDAGLAVDLHARVRGVSFGVLVGGQQC